MDEINLENAILLLDGNRGIYIPKIFAECFPLLLSDEQKADLSNPDNEFYWETWEDVIDNIKIPFQDKMYYLYQSGDLWAVPDENWPSVDRGDD